jgi:3',5'-nucleoside bisphosphate phosphatase
MRVSMRQADLHTHTWHSDGTRSPKEVVDLAKASGITVLAISDHDNLAAYFEIRRYAATEGVALIPAAELSAEFRGIDIHILAYAFDPGDGRIATRLESFRNTRARRCEVMVERLAALGYPISIERVREFASEGAMGRPHVARALVEAGYVADLREAFERFLKQGCAAYVAKERFSIPEAVDMIRAAGGVTSIAHPTLYPDHERIVPDILDLAVDGIEAIHPDVDASWSEHYIALAESRGLIVTGGSDDHGTAKMMETLGTIKVPEERVGAILARLS